MSDDKNLFNGMSKREQTMLMGVFNYIDMIADPNYNNGLHTIAMETFPDYKDGVEVAHKMLVAILCRYDREMYPNKEIELNKEIKINKDFLNPSNN